MKDGKKMTAEINSWIFLLFICLVTCIMGIGFASINTLFDITGEILATAQDGVFITEVNYISNVNADLEKSKIISTYQTILESDIALSNTNANSKITYQVKVYNSTDSDYAFEEAAYMLGADTYDNENIVFSLEGLLDGAIIKSKETATFNITFYYKNNTLPANNELKSIINFKFKKVVQLVKAGTLNTTSVAGIFGSSIQKSSVERIYFVDHEVVPSGATKWDASLEGDYAITGWVVDDNQNGLYEMYLGANNGRISLPANCNSLFYWYTSLVSIDFANVDTSEVTDMSYMFAYSYFLTELNLSTFDTSKVTTMAYMFNSVSKIETFDLSSFETPSTTSMSYMFSGCSPKLVKLNKATFTHLPTGKVVIPNISSALIVVVKDTTERDWIDKNTYHGANTEILTVEEYKTKYPN